MKTNINTFLTWLTERPHSHIASSVALTLVITLLFEQAPFSAMAQTGLLLDPEEIAELDQTEDAQTGSGAVVSSDSSASSEGSESSGEASSAASESSSSEDSSDSFESSSSNVSVSPTVMTGSLTSSSVSSDSVESSSSAALENSSSSSETFSSASSLSSVMTGSVTSSSSPESIFDAVSEEGTITVEGLSGNLATGSILRFPSNTHPTFELPLHKEIRSKDELEARLILDVVNPNGETVDIESSIDQDGGKYVLTLHPPRTFVPGTYHVKSILSGTHGENRRLQRLLRAFGDDDILLFETDLLWGGVAFNTDKDVYLPEEEAKISFAILSSDTQLLCGSNPVVEITTPDEDVMTFTTEEDGGILSRPCDSPLDLADYTLPVILDTEGTYDVSIKMGDAVLLSDRLRVKSDEQMVRIERSAPTQGRFGETQEMTITVTPRSTFIGVITESLPASLEVTDLEDLATLSQGDDYTPTTITWKLKLQAGEETVLRYHFTAPEVLPASMALFGPLSLIGTLDNDKKVEDPVFESEVSSSSSIEIVESSSSSDSSSSSSDGSVFSNQSSSVSVSSESSTSVTSSSSSISSGVSSSVNSSDERSESSSSGLSPSIPAVLQENLLDEEEAEVQLESASETTNLEFDGEQEPAEEPQEPQLVSFKGSALNGLFFIATSFPIPQRAFIAERSRPTLSAALIAQIENRITWEEDKLWQFYSLPDKNDKRARTGTGIDLEFVEEREVYSANEPIEFHLAEYDFTSTGEILEDDGTLTEEAATHALVDLVLKTEDIENVVASALLTSGTDETTSVVLEEDSAAAKAVSAIITKEVEDKVVEEVVEAVLQNEDAATALKEIGESALAVIDAPARTEQVKEVLEDVQPETATDAPTEIKPIVSVKLIGKDGKEFTPNFHFKKGSVLLVIDPIRQFTPGLYTATVTVTNPLTGEETVYEQDFAWGVLAINSDKDVYRVGEKAKLHFGVLDDEGEIVCDAGINLSVTSPSGEVVELSTEDQSITVTQSCAVKEAGFIEPDFETIISLTESGTYVLDVEATTENGVRTLREEIQVNADHAFSVSREAATRLWPFAPSPMNITVRFREDFEGTITDIVPAGFEIVSSDPEAEIDTISDESGSGTTITWTGSWEEGDKETFTYVYDAPDISPEFYLVGPLHLQAGESLQTENRAWQIANDALDPFDDNTYIGSMSGAEVTGGILRNTDMDEGTVLTFNGSSSYVDAGTTTNLRFGQTGQFSLAAWVKTSSTSAGYIVSRLRASGNDHFGYGMNLTAAGRLNVLIDDSNQAQYTLASDAAGLNDGQWHHVAMTYSNKVISLYVDGVFDKTGTHTLNAATNATNEFTIGVQHYDNVFGTYFNGMMDDVRVYASALSTDEVARIFRNDIEIDTSYLRGWWKFNEGTGNSLSDSSYYGSTASMSGHPATWTTTHNSFYTMGSRVTSEDLSTANYTQDRFDYGTARKPGGTLARLQFSDDGSVWKNSNGDAMSGYGAYEFDGVNDNITAGSDTSIDDIFSAGGTMMYWFNAYSFGSASGFGRIFHKGPNAANTTATQVYLSSTAGTLHFRRSFSTTTGEWSVKMPSLRQWNHMAIVYNESSTSNDPIIYINGTEYSISNGGLTEVTAPVGTASSDAATTMNIGSRGTDAYFNGMISDFRIYKGDSLSASSIYNYFAKGIEPSETEDAHFKFNGNATDETGTNNGTVSGATNTTNWYRLPAIGDSALSNTNTLRFDGVNDLVTTVDNNAFSFGNGTTDAPFSLSAWVYMEDASNFTIISKNNTSNREWNLKTSATDFLTFFLIDESANANLALTSTTALTSLEGKWIHVAATYSGNRSTTGMKMYINGNLVPNTPSVGGTYTAMENKAEPLVIGSNPFGGTFAKGRIANAAIWDEERTAADIITSANTGYEDITDANLIGFWSLDEGTGTAVDNTEGTATYDGTISGATWLQDPYRPASLGALEGQFDISGLSFNGDFYYRTMMVSADPQLSFGFGEVEEVGLTEFTLNGTLYNQGGTGTLASKTIAMSVEGGAVSQTFETTAEGLFSFTGAMPGTGSVITLFVDGETEKGVMVLTSSGVNMHGIDLYQNKLIIRNESGSYAITNADLNTADGSGDSDISDILVSASAGAATVGTGYILHIWPDTTFAPGGTVVAHDILVDGTLDTDGHDLVVRGDFDLRNGTFISGENTVTFEGDAQTIYGSGSFFNLTKNVSVASSLFFQAGSQQTVENALSLKGIAANLLSLSGGGGDYAHPFQALGTTATNFGNISDYRMGYKFVPSTDIIVSQLGNRCGSATRNVKLYACADSNCLAGSELASVSVTSVDDTTWVYEDIDPVSLTAGSYYIVASRNDDTNYCSNAFTQGVVSEGITIVDGICQNDATDTVFPSGSCGGTNYGGADIAIGGGSAKLTLDASTGTQDLEYLQVSGIDARYGQELECNIYTDGCVDADDNVNWDFGTFRIAGTLYSDEGVTPLAGKTIALSVNGGAVTKREDTDAGGQYRIEGVAMTGGTILTLYVDGESEDAVTVTLGSGSNMTGVHLYQNHLIARSDSGSVAITNAHLGIADDVADTDITAFYSIDANSRIHVASDKELFVWAGDTYTPGGRVRARDIEVRGTMNLGTNTLYLTGSLLGATGSVNSSTGIVLNSLVTASQTLALGSGSVTDVNINNGLISYWSFNEGAGTKAKDSVSGINGTFTNMEAADWFTNVPDRVQYYNPTSLDFDGTNEYLAMGTEATLNGAREFTFSAWVRPDVLNFPSYDGIYARGSNGQRTPWIYGNQNASTISIDFETTTGGVGDGFGTTAAVTTGWNHIVFTWNGSKVVTYTNGVRSATTDATTGNTMATADLETRIGFIACCDYWNGRIDEVRIYNRAINDGEVTALYNGNKTTGSGTYTLGSTLDINGDLNIYGGTLDAHSSNNYTTTIGENFLNTGNFVSRQGTVSFDGSGNQTLSGSTIFNNLTATTSTARTLYLDYTSRQSASGSLTLRGVTGNLLSVRSTKDGTAARLMLDGDSPQNQTIDYVDVKNSNAAGGATLVCGTSTEGCVNSTGNTNWSFYSSSVTGTLYSDEGVTPLAGKTVTVSINGGAAQQSDVTDAGGQFVIPNLSITGAVMAIYVNNEAEDAVLVTLGSGSNMSGMNLYQNRLILRSDSGSYAMTNARLDQAELSADNDILALYSVSGSVLRMREGKELIVWAGDRYEPGNNIEVDDLDINGRLSLLNYYASVSGTFDAQGGAFTSTGTITFDSRGNETIHSGGNSFYDVIIESPTEANLTGFWKFDEGSGAQSIDSSPSTLTGTNVNVYSSTHSSTIRSYNPYYSYFGGNSYVNLGTVNTNFTSGFSSCVWMQFWDTWSTTKIFDFGQGQADDNIYMGMTSGFLTFQVYSGGSSAGSVSASSNYIQTNKWTHLCATLDNSGNVALYIDGVQVQTGTTSVPANVSRTSSFIGESNWAADGGLNGYMDELRVYNTGLSPAEILNIFRDGNANGDSATATYTLSSSIDVNNTMEIKAGILSAGANNITVAKNWLNKSGASGFNPGTATVTFDGTSQKVTGTGSFRNMTKTVASADTFSMSNTQSISHALTLQGAAANLITVRPGITRPIDELRFTNYSSFAAGGTTYNMGYRFVPHVNGQVTQFHYKCVNGNTVTVKLYECSTTDCTAGTDPQIATGGTLVSTGVTNWVSETITPVSLQAGHVYYIGAVMNSGDTVCQGTVPRTPVTIGDITILSGMYNSADTSPTSDLGNSLYGTPDFTFIPTDANKIILDASTGTQTLEYLGVRKSDASGGQNLSCLTGCIDNGFNPNWTFSNPSRSISGTVYSDEGVTPLANKTVAVSLNGGILSDTAETNESGQYSIEGLTLTGGTIISLYLDNESQDAVTVTRGSGGTMGAVDLYQNHLIVRSESGSLTNVHLNVADNNGDSDILAVFRSESDNTISVGIDKELYVWPADTFVPGARLKTHDLEVRGTLTLGTNGLTVSGSLVTQSGSITSSTGILLNSRGSLETLNVGSNALQHLKLGNGITVVANSVTGFSSTQGLNNWYYYRSMPGTNTYDALTYINEGGWSVGTPSSAYGYIFQGSAYAHPGYSLGWGDSVRAWKAPTNGAVTISATISDSNNGCGDGIRYMVKKNSTELYNQTFNNNFGSTVISLNTTVLTNDFIYFRINDKTGDLGCDGTNQNITITFSSNSSSGAYVLGSDLDVNGDMSLMSNGLVAGSHTIAVGGNWNNQTGTGFVKGTSTVTFDGTGSQTLSGTTVFNNLVATTSTARTLYLDSSGNQVASGALTLRGVSGNKLSIRSTSNGVAARLRLDVDSAANQTIDYLDVKDANASSGALLVCGAASEGCTNSGNNRNWSFYSSSVTGTLYSDEGVTPLAGKTVTVSINGGAAQQSDVTDAGGQFVIPNLSITGAVMAIYVNNEAEDAVLVTLGSGSNMSGMNLYQNRLILRSDSGSYAMTNAFLNQAELSEDTDITTTYSVSGSVLRMREGKELFIWAGEKYEPRNRIEVDNIDINGTLSLVNYHATVSGTFDAQGGTFTSTGTITFDSRSNETIHSGGNSFYDVIFASPTEANLTGLWKFDEDSGNSIIDESPSTLTGTLVGSAFRSSYLNTQRENNPYYTYFTGSLYANLGTVNTDFTDGFSSCTWVQFWDTWSTSKIFDLGQGQADDNIYLGIASGVLTFQVYNGGSSAGSISADSYAIPGNSWIHICATVDDNGDGAIYVNGAEIDTGETSVPANVSRTSSFIGDSNWEADSGLNGYLDELRIYNRALSHAEILNVFRGGFANGDSATATYTLNSSLDVNNTLEIKAGTLSAGSNNITVAKNFINTSGVSGFNPGTGTVTFDGTFQKLSGTGSFRNITKTVASADTFSMNNTQSISHALTLQGAASNLLTYRTAITRPLDEVRFDYNATFSPGGTPYTMGYRFTPHVNGQITQLRHKCINGNAVTIKVYECSTTECTAGTDSEIASASVTALGASSWATQNITPVTLQAGSVYFVGAAFTSGDTVCYGTASHATFTSGDITVLSGMYSSTDTSPTQDSGQTIYGLPDFTFIPTSSHKLDLDETTGTQTVQYLKVRNSNASDGQLMSCLTGCFDNGGNSNWAFSMTGRTIMGTVYSDEGSTPLANKTVALSLNGGAAEEADDTDVNGAFSIEGITMTGGALLTLYLDGETQKGVTVTLGSGLDMEGIDIYQDHLITRTDSGSVALTSAHLNNADASGDSDIAAIYGVTSANVLQMVTSKKLFVWTGDTYQPGAKVRAHDLTVKGTLAMGTNSLTVTGSLLAGSGTLNSSTGILLYNQDETETLTVGSNTLSTLTIDGGLAEGLVAYWNFDEGSGTAAYDSSGNGRTATLVNMEADDWSATVPTTNYSNPYSLNFDSASSEYVNIGTISTNFATNGISLCAWVRYDAFNSWSRIFDIAQGQADDNILFANNGNGSNLTYQVYIGNAGGTAVTANSALATGQWIHLCATETSGGAVTIYKNGSSIQTGTTSVPANVSRNSSFIARSNWSGDGYYDGRMDDSRIYSRVLTPAEVLSLASGNSLSGTGTYVLGADLDLNGSLNIRSGVLDVSESSHSINISGDYNNRGTLRARTGTVTFDGTGNQTISGSTVFNNFIATTSTARTLFFDHNTRQSVSGALVMHGIQGNLLSIRSTKSGTDADIALDAQSGTQTLDHLDVKDNNASGGTPLICYTGEEGCVNSNNNTNWIFTKSIAGRVFWDEGTKPIGSPTVAVSINGGTPATASADSEGRFSVSGLTMTGGSIIAVYINNQQLNALTVTLGSGSSMSGINLYNNRMIVQSNSGTYAITNEHLKIADDSGDGDITTFYSVSGGNLTVRNGYELFVQTGSTFAPGGTITAQNIDIRGTLNAGNNAVTISGKWNQFGAYTSTTTTTFDGTMQQISGTGSFYNLTKNVSSEDTLFFSSGNQRISNLLTLRGAAGNLLNVVTGRGYERPLVDAELPITFTGGSDYNMGFRFTVNADGVISQLGTRCDAGTSTVRLYECADIGCTTGTEVASASVQASGFGSGTYVDIAPVAVTAGQDYIVAVRSGSNNYCYGYNNDFSSIFPRTIGSITLEETRYSPATDDLPLSIDTLAVYGQPDFTFLADTTTDTSKITLDASTGDQVLEYLGVRGMNASDGALLRCSLGCENNGNNTNWAFVGPTGTGTILGYVWSDANGDGIKDVSETSGLSGVTLDLDGTTATGAALSLSTRTISSGFYAFTGAIISNPSGYTVAIDTATVPAGYLRTRATSTGGLVLGTGGTIAAHFGYVQASTLSGSVYLDANQNGTREAGENEVFSGVTLTLTGTSATGGTINTVARSNANGVYLMNGLPPTATNYVLTITAPANHSITSTLVRNVAISAGGQAKFESFGFKYNRTGSGTLQGFVWNDVDGDGLKDSAETAGLSGVILGLTGNTITGAVLGLVDYSRSTGHYAFSGVTISNLAGYTVAVQGGTAGYIKTRPTSSGGNIIGTGTIVNVNFAFVQASTLSGAIFLDGNLNGVKDADETTGYSGALLTLTGTTSTGAALNITTHSNADGVYTFAYLAPTATGYTLTITNPVGTYATTTVSREITIATGGQVRNEAFGFHAGHTGSGTIKGTVWYDADGDGIREGSDAEALSGVTIDLTGNTSTGVLVELTDHSRSTGHYAFSGVTISDATGYTVSVTTPMTGYLKTRPTSSGSIVLGTGAVVNVNFGYVLPSTLSGSVFLDSDEDGEKDELETTVFSGSSLSLTGTSATGGTVAATAVANASGVYAFSNIAPTATFYLLVLTPPEGYSTTSTNSRSVTIGTGGQLKFESFGFIVTPEEPAPDAEDSSSSPAQETGGTRTSEPITVTIRPATPEDVNVPEISVPSTEDQRAERERQSAAAAAEAEARERALAREQAEREQAREELVNRVQEVILESTPEGFVSFENAPILAIPLQRAEAALAAIVEDTKIVLANLSEKTAVAMESVTNVLSTIANKTDALTEKVTVAVDNVQAYIAQSLLDNKDVIVSLSINVKESLTDAAESVTVAWDTFWTERTDNVVASVETLKVTIEITTQALNKAGEAIATGALTVASVLQENVTVALNNIREVLGGNAGTASEVALKTLDTIENTIAGAAKNVQSVAILTNTYISGGVATVSDTVVSFTESTGEVLSTTVLKTVETVNDLGQKTIALTMNTVDAVVVEAGENIQDSIDSTIATVTTGLTIAMQITEVELDIGAAGIEKGIEIAVSVIDNGTETVTEGVATAVEIAANGVDAGVGLVSDTVTVAVDGFQTVNHAVVETVAGGIVAVVDIYESGKSSIAQTFENFTAEERPLYTPPAEQPAYKTSVYKQDDQVIIASLHLSVLNSFGEPQAHTPVVLFSTPKIAVTNEEGTATFHDVETGEHRLEIHKENGEIETRDIVLEPPTELLAQREDEERVDVVLPVVQVLVAEPVHGSAGAAVPVFTWVIIIALIGASNGLTFFILARRRKNKFV